MRLLIAFVVMTCCAVTGYSQETTESPAAEVTVGGEDCGDCTDVAENVESHNGDAGCPCGKPKI